MPFFKSVFVATIALLGLASAANADIVFSNFSPAGGSGFNTSTLAFDSLFVGNGGNGLTRHAAPFTVGATRALTSADMAVRYVGGTNTFIASVTEDDTGISRPNEARVLSSATLSGISSTASVVTFAFTSAPVLTSGRTYWLVLSPGGDTATARWQRNTTGDTGSAVTPQPVGGWDPNSATAPAFRINGAVVPEAGTVVLLAAGIGLASVGAWGRRSARLS